MAFYNESSHVQVNIYPCGCIKREISEEKWQLITLKGYTTDKWSLQENWQWHELAGGFANVTCYAIRCYDRFMVIQSKKTSVAVT